MSLPESRTNGKANCVSGGDNKLAVVVQSADNANVQCLGGPAPHYEDCFLIVHSMVATMQRQTFGSIGDPTIDNPLPHAFYSCKFRNFENL